MIVRNIIVINLSCLLCVLNVGLNLLIGLWKEYYRIALAACVVFGMPWTTWWRCSTLKLKHPSKQAHISLDMYIKKTLFKRILGMVSRYALNEIAGELDRVKYFGNDPSSCGCAMRSTHGLLCACELSRYVVASIPLESVHMFWRRLHFSQVCCVC